MLSNTFLPIPQSDSWLEYDPAGSIVDIVNATTIALEYVFDTATGTPHPLVDQVLEQISQKIYFRVRGTGDNAKVFITSGVPDKTVTKITDENKVLLELDTLVKSIPVTETFHHLGHEGKVFIHSDRHGSIANGANFDMLIRIPAGNAARQVHMRFNYVGKALTGTLDADVILYKDVIVSADGTPESIMSTNDAVVKNTGVLMFHGPTIDTEPADLGTQKAWTFMVGEKKGANSKEQSVPEYILAPDENNARDYLIRLTNNSGGIMNVVNAIFFYDSEAT